MFTLKHLDALRLSLEMFVLGRCSDVVDWLHFTQFSLMNLVLLFIPLLVQQFANCRLSTVHLLYSNFNVSPTL